MNISYVSIKYTNGHLKCNNLTNDGDLNGYFIGEIGIGVICIVLFIIMLICYFCLFYYPRSCMYMRVNYCIVKINEWQFNKSNSVDMIVEHIYDLLRGNPSKKAIY